MFLAFKVYLSASLVWDALRSWSMIEYTKFLGEMEMEEFCRCACAPLEGVGGGILIIILLLSRFHPLLFPRLRGIPGAYSLQVNNDEYFL